MFSNQECGCFESEERGHVLCFLQLTTKLEKTQGIQKGTKKYKVIASEGVTLRNFFLYATSSLSLFHSKAYGISLLDLHYEIFSTLLALLGNATSVI